eukprot:CAMPEP_0179145114 /NCGR_PEP_ID=MMETSP0796-20121207/69979_1 /TAXON_ID=73915 /ORGANISM="Pyrodinium bahamense, Strain pbaha01" /LENGTH=233 /DNA_ID=CAMNT_0020845447 /DNA_START=15 /DNA_END=717 /DNA_ORIENTATION=-
MSVAGCPQLFRKRPASYSATQTPSKWCRSGIDGGQRVVPSSPCLQAPQGPNLRLFMKSYHGLEDYHLQLFRQVQKVARARHVLYPGCFRHVTASLVFPDVSYVDFDAAVEPTFSDERVLAWVQEHKLYKQMAQVRFYCHNFQKELPRHAPRSFDMLISMSAGIVSETCGKYLRQGGHFLASDAHFEARLLASQPESYKLVGVYDLARRGCEQAQGRWRGTSKLQVAIYLLRHR